MPVEFAAASQRSVHVPAHTKSELPMTHSVRHFGTDVSRENSIFNYYVQTNYTAAGDASCILRCLIGSRVCGGRRVSWSQMDAGKPLN